MLHAIQLLYRGIYTVSVCCFCLLLFCSVAVTPTLTDSTPSPISAESIALQHQLPNRSLCMLSSYCMCHVWSVVCVGIGQVATQQAQLTGMVMQCHQAQLHFQLQTPARIQTSHPSLLRQRTPPMQALAWGAALKVSGSQTPLPHPPAPPGRRMPSIRSSCSRDTETG